MSLKNRTVTNLIHPQTVREGAGVLLKRSFPTQNLDFPDPFLLLDHFGSDDPQDYLAGFPMHPHRGIETVTYMLAGEVTHRDSLGNSGTIGAGDVQWMTAGGGIMHEEMPQPVQGRMEGFQLWVNLPASLKMTHPKYQGFTAGELPLVQLDNEASIRVIAGSAFGTTGPVAGIRADPTYLDVNLLANTTFTFPAPANHTVLVYLYRGKASFGKVDDPFQEPASAPCLAVLSDGEVVQVQSHAQGARFLLVSALPINEPIVRYGPFVMNTQEEIRQALRDLRSGTFVMR
jgi:redox-sensitive bicupin YhaK (pirin superfamily)